VIRRVESDVPGRRPTRGSGLGGVGDMFGAGAGPLVLDEVDALVHAARAASPTMIDTDTSVRTARVGL
jgi:hypothetical protein